MQFISAILKKKPNFYPNKYFHQKKSLKVHPLVVYIFQFFFFKQVKQSAENFNMRI